MKQQVTKFDYFREQFPMATEFFDDMFHNPVVQLVKPLENEHLAALLKGISYPFGHLKLIDSVGEEAACQIAFMWLELRIMKNPKVKT